MAHPVERELIKTTAYKTRTKFSDRQDYLGSILNAVMKLTDDDFENLSDEAAEWANAAVHAKNSKEDIPDFDEVTADEEGSEPEDDAEDDSEEADDEADDETEEEDEVDGDDVSDDSEPATASDDTASGDDAGDPEDDEVELDDEGAEEEPDEDEADEPEPKAKPAAKKAGKKPAHKMKVPPKEKPVKPKLHNRNPRAHEDEDVIMDKWGCMEGSKNSRALALFEKGATSKEVKDSLGGTYYNILKKMEQDGHTLEKEGSLIRVVHKDEKAKKAATKPAAKAAPAKPVPKKGKK